MSRCRCGGCTLCHEMPRCPEYVDLMGYCKSCIVAEEQPRTAGPRQKPIPIHQRLHDPLKEPSRWRPMPHHQLLQTATAHAESALGTREGVNPVGGPAGAARRRHSLNDTGGQGGPNDS